MPQLRVFIEIGQRASSMLYLVLDQKVDKSDICFVIRKRIGFTTKRILHDLKL